jgi:uncharacterized protein DUF2510
VGTVGIVVLAVVVAGAFFALGWTRAARYRAERGRPPWGISPEGWGALFVVLPVGWVLYSAASRTTAVSDPTLAHRPVSVIADTPEEREKLMKIVGQLPLLPPPQPDQRGWHPDPLSQKDFRFFDGQHWTREVTDNPAQRVAAVVGDERADLERRLRALPPPADNAASWHLDPLGEHHFRYFDGQAWTTEVRETRSS